MNLKVVKASRVYILNDFGKKNVRLGRGFEETSVLGKVLKSVKFGFICLNEFSTKLNAKVFVVFIMILILSSQLIN